MATLQECVANRMMKEGLEKGFEQVEASELEWDALFTVVSQNTKLNHKAKDEFALWFMYEQGKGVDKDENLAQKFLKEAALGGHVDAQLKMANMENKLHWLSAAAAGGSAKGQLALAQYYVEQKEMELAIGMLELCIQQHNDKDAKKSLHNVYVSQGNTTKAMPLLQSMVHEHGMESACMVLADCYLNGKGVDVCKEKVWLYLGAGLLSKDKKCLEQIAYLMWNGHGSLMAKGSNDLKFEFAKKAAEAGSVHDRARLALCYKDGIGTATDLKKAWATLQECKEDKWAQYFMGEYYATGLAGVVEKDEKKAFELYLASAEQGDADALFAVGECYRMGTGTDMDKTKAKLYFEKAAAKGNSNATQKLQMTVMHF